MKLRLTRKLLNLQHNQPREGNTSRGWKFFIFLCIHYPSDLHSLTKQGKLKRLYIMQNSLKTLRLIRGQPGSGKSTYAHNPAFRGMLVIESDQYWVTEDGQYNEDQTRHQEGKDYMYNMTESALINGANVIVCDVFNHAKEVEKYAQLASKYHYRFLVAYMTGQFKSIHESRIPAHHFEPYPGEAIIYPREDGEYVLTEPQGPFGYGDSLANISSYVIDKSGKRRQATSNDLAACLVETFNLKRRINNEQN